MVCYCLVWFGMVWYGMVWYGLVWFGMVWYGLVWFGMVWYCLVWFGMEGEGGGGQMISEFIQGKISKLCCGLQGMDYDGLS